MLAYKGFVHLEMQRAIWGLPQAGILAIKRLRRKLAPFGYYKHVKTPSLWYHETRPILFTLVVADCGVKYVNKEDIDHLIASIKKSICLDWDYKIKRLTFPCLVMLKRNCKSIITLQVNASKLVRTCLPRNSSVQRRNFPSPQIRHQNWIRRGSRRFKNCQ